MPGLSSYVTIVALVLAAALPFIKGGLKKHIETLLLIVCTVAAFLFFAQLRQGAAGPQKIQARIAEERAESVLRMMSTINVGVAGWYSVFASAADGKDNDYRALDLSNTRLDNYFKTAEASLKEAMRCSPDDNVLKSKLVVLLSVWKKDKGLAKSTCILLKRSKVESEKELGEVLFDVFIQHDSLGDAQYISRKVKTVRAGLPRGWYQDNALLSLYKLSGNSGDYKAFARQLESRYYSAFSTGFMALLFGCLAALTGIVVIAVQTALLARKDPQTLPDSERLGLDLSFATVYAIFVGWIATQLAIGEGLKLLPHNLFSAGGNPLGMASGSLLLYVVSMSPALALIYVIAFRPRGWNWNGALKIRWRTLTLGPIRILLSAFLAWCAIIPLVFVGSTVATALGAQGSDNPILPQIAFIAGSGNVPAIGLLFLNVACLAPFFEEIIFRGFLYSVLRMRLGVFPAVLCSALFFAGMHFDRGGVLMLFALGLVLAVTFEKTRSLLSCMVAHGLWNGGAFALTFCLYFS